MADRRIAYLIGFVVLLGIIGAAYIASTNTQTAGTVQMPLQLTDPPHVPSGTTSLIISYSSLQVHTVNNGWISASGAGSVDLMSLQNVSQVIGSVNVPVNSTVDMARFDINSANITINGTTYPVTIPSSQLTARVVEHSKVNASTGILFDLSPTIISIFTLNSTDYVLVPSVKAIAIGSGRAHPVGARFGLNADEYAELQAAAPNISITSESLVYSDNSTHLSVTVMDNSNKSVTLTHVNVLGDAHFSVYFNVTCNSFSECFPRIFSAGNMINVSSQESAQESVKGNLNSQSRPWQLETDGPISGSMNQSANAAADAYPGIYNTRSVIGRSEINSQAAGNAQVGAGAGATASVNGNVVINGNFNVSGISSAALRIESREHEEGGGISFIVESNGTLAVPFSDSQFGNIGYTLSPGQSVTLSFTGPVTFGNGHIVISPVVGSQYKVTVFGDQGAMANATVTASS